VVVLAFFALPLEAAETRGTPHFHFQMLVIDASEDVRNSLKEGDLWKNVESAVREGKAELRFAGSALVAEHRFAQLDGGTVRVLDVRIRGIDETKEFEVTPYVAYRKNSRKFRALLEPGIPEVLFETVLDEDSEKEELLAVVRILEV